MLRTIAEDATRYFLFIFTSHFALAMVLSFGRVRLATVLLSGVWSTPFNACLFRNRSNFFHLQPRKSFPAYPQYNNPHYPSWSPRSAAILCKFYSYSKTRSTKSTPGSRFLPVMISRLMLSLRKAAYRQQNNRSSVSPRTDRRSFQNMMFFRPRRSTISGGDDIPLDTYRES